MQHDLYRTAAEMIALFRRGELSPVDAVRRSLARIEETADTINAFVLVDAEGALDAARATERRWREGSPLGPLDGIPFALKDSNWARGWPTRIGSRTTSSAPEATDAPYVRSLRDAGAVFVGKTATPEFCWTGSTFSPLGGITRNPWDTTRGVGGSSGGAAAAIAGDMVPLALGTDAGGSIRTPAGLCGTVGFKPSFGRVTLDPRDGYSTFNSVGPLAHTVDDALLVFRILLGETPPLAPSPPPRLSGLRVAISPTMGYARFVAGGISAAVSRAADVLSDLGAAVTLADPPLDWPVDVYNTMGWAEQAHALGPVVDAHAGEMEPGLVEIVGVGRRIGLAAYLDAVKQRASICSTMADFHRSYDVLVTPTLPTTAFAAGSLTPDGNEVTTMNDWLPFSSVFNLTGQPALSVPCGFDEGGLPFGIQFVGAPGRDFDILEAGRAYEHATGSSAAFRAAYAERRIGPSS